MSPLLAELAKGATVKAAAARTGTDPALAEVMAQEYAALGLLQLPGQPQVCTTCHANSKKGLARLGCAGCPFAR